MKTIPWLLAGVLVGALAMYGKDYFAGPDEGSQEGGEVLTEGEARPRLSGDDAEISVRTSGGSRWESAESSGGATSSRAASDVDQAFLVPPVLAVAESIPTPAAYQTPSASSEILIQKAREELQRGNKDQAISWLRGILQQARLEPGADFTEETRLLLSLDENPNVRRQCLQYLQQKGQGSRAFDDQLRRASVLATASETPLQTRAWDELSIAYDVAADSRQRARVLGILDPYMQQMVFSQRFSPILTHHTVTSGENLHRIAVRYGTTVDALVRLNRLSSEMIRPRTRLLALSGKVHIFVDKSEYRLWVTVDDRIFLERAIGLGRDGRTPVGNFSIRIKQKEPTWFPPEGPEVPAGDPQNVLGSRWLGFKDTDKHTGFGLHCTSNPGDIGRESSSGCIRLLTEDMELVYDFIPRGTPVTIRE